MSSWVRRVRPGDPAGTFDIGGTYRLPEHAEGRLLGGDESALPAILPILDDTPAPLTTEVCLEVAAKADIRAVPERDIPFTGYWRLGRSTPG